ncbi:16S rRNA (guanine(966)-N(2))-methyltransferase RsmD [Candidatus Bipolaricaulota bacterium]|nr:16S rRNA (guanine(966)-N(2))-methyltransferase RsmD [Candidatus Bipolaricaulota bacterium]
MRIIGGSRKGRRLVPWEDTGIRPMRDFVRSALYSILYEFVPDARFLDLFAGTGSVGLEALSRGADSCVFVDASEYACGIVRRNLEMLGLMERGQVLCMDYEDAIDHLARRGRRFDLVFIGPPYGKGLAAAAVERVAAGRPFGLDPVVVAEVRKGEPLPESSGDLVRVDRRKYGDNELHFYRQLEEHGGRRANEEVDRPVDQR